SAITSPRPRSGGRSISRGYLALFATVIIWSLPSLFPILSAALLRCLGAKFLSLQCRLHRDRTLCRLSHSARRTAVRSSRVRPLSDPSSPKRRPSNHPNDCPLSQRSRRLRHFHPFFGDHDRATCAHFLPEERHILRQWQFQVGTLLGLLGAIGVFWFQPGATAGHVA